MTVHDFDWFAARVEPARWNDERVGSRDFLGACPVHGGSDSLHVTEKGGGKVLVKCFGCDAKYDAVVAALEVPSSAPRITRVKREQPAKTEARRESFDVRDADGKLVARHTRIDYADGSKAFLWPPGTKPATLPLYGSEDVAKFDPSLPVVVTEGERKRDRLKAAGVQAVALAGGSSVEPSAASLSLLSGLRVVLWPDNDAPGRKVMDRAARKLAGVAASVSAVSWPDAPEKGDAADYLDAHSDAECADLIASAPPWSPAYDEDFIAEWASDLDLTPPKPLLLGYLEPDDYTVLFGDGGTGKGVVATWFASQLIRAGWVVVLLDYEQNTLLEWAPRVAAFGGDLAKLRVIQPSGAIWDHAERVRSDAVESGEAHGAPVYLIVDSIGYAIGDSKLEDSATATKFKKALNAINLPTLSLAHTTKANSDPRWPFGSVYWHNNVRHTISISRKDGEADEDAPRVLRNKKVNRRAPFATVEIDWSWVHGDLPSRLDFRAAEARTKTSTRLAAALSSGPKTIRELAAALASDGEGDPVNEAAVAAALQRGEEFSSDGKKPASWSVLQPPRIARVRANGTRDS